MLERVWAAGFFDGEGTVFCNVRIDGRTDAPSRRIQVSIAQSGSPELLERFRDAVGVGIVRGPYYHRNPEHQPFWQYSATRQVDVVQIRERIGLWLGSVKRSAMDDALAAWDSYHPSRRLCEHGVWRQQCVPCRSAWTARGWDARRAREAASAITDSEPAL